MRSVVFFLGASVFTLGLFWVMQQMISGPADFDEQMNTRAQVDFVRLKQDSRTELKDRRKAPPPELKKPQTPQQNVSQETPMESAPIDISLPDIAMNMNISNTSMLGDAVVGMGMGDGDVLPLVRAQAQYPPRAWQRKIEGYVTARLFINAEGTVDDVEIVQAEPKGIFEREAIRAMYRYKFKPKMEGGKAVAQVALQTLEFKLSE